jgi:predicted RecB family nuclease
MADADRSRITWDVLESFTKCKYKAYLKLSGEQGTHSAYEMMLTAQKHQIMMDVTRMFAESVASNKPTRCTSATDVGIENRHIISEQFEDDIFSIQLNVLGIGNTTTGLGSNYREPLLFDGSHRVLRHHRLLLAICGLLLARFQGITPQRGYIWHGLGNKRSSVQLRAYRLIASRELKELIALQVSGIPPTLFLNEHCQTCEFQARCRLHAKEEDNLSLLSGITQKEITRLKSHGIFTLTQLSYTFRARRRAKRVKTKTRPHSFPLQALAIREKAVFVHGQPKLSGSGTKIYFDIEGVPDSAYYLIGTIVQVGG